MGEAITTVKSVSSNAIVKVERIVYEKKTNLTPRQTSWLLETANIIPLVACLT